VLTTIILSLAACSSPPPPPSPPSGGAPAPEAGGAATCALACAQGGTVDVPWNDAAKMKELQGLDGSSHAKVTIQWPAEDQVIEEGKGVIKYTLEGYSIGKDEAGGFQHCHCILDDKAYEADYDHTTTLEQLNGGKTLEEGSHLLTIFPARNFHLSVKSPGACAQVRFHVKTKSGKVPSATDPQVIASRPKGAYDSAKGEAKAILCDFYLLNVPLEADQRLKDLNVVITLDGPDHKGEKIRSYDWRPLILLRDAKPGKYTVSIELEERDDGDPLDVPFARTTREVLVK
jgi:hypothetical protein